VVEGGVGRRAWWVVGEEEEWWQGGNALGLKWHNVGPAKPTPGKELEHPRLREALGDKTEFTQHEWDGFGVANLRVDHFVKSGDDYYKPAGNVSLTAVEKSRAVAKCGAGGFSRFPTAVASKPLGEELRDAAGRRRRESSDAPPSSLNTITEMGIGRETGGCHRSSGDSRVGPPGGGSEARGALGGDGEGGGGEEARVPGGAMEADWESRSSTQIMFTLFRPSPSSSTCGSSG